MNLKEMQKKFHIKRINFDKIKPSGCKKSYGTNQLVCPYCSAINEYEYEDESSLLEGTNWQCCSCGKWFYADGEISMETTCTPIEDKILEPNTQICIKLGYQHMDECEKAGTHWDSPFGTVEYLTYKQYAEPLFENAKKEARDAKNSEM